MMNIHSRLFGRIMARNPEAYVLKVITLSVAFAVSILVSLFSINEFGYDRFHDEAKDVFRVLQKNSDEQYSGNRLSARIPGKVFTQLRNGYQDSVIVSRVKILNKVTVLAAEKSFDDQRIHAADPDIRNIFSFHFVQGHADDFVASHEVAVMMSAKTAKKYTGTIDAVGQKIKLCAFKDTIDVRIVAIYEDFPANSHEDFNVFMAFNPNALATLNFEPEVTAVYGRVRQPGVYEHHYSFDEANSQRYMTYRFQRLPDLYFGPRVLGEEARHGDRYSVVILICIASLILFLALSGFINLSTLTLPHRSKEIAVKKLAGTSQGNLVRGFLRESSVLVGLSLLIGTAILIVAGHFFESRLNLLIVDLFFDFDQKLIQILVVLFIGFAVSPVLMALRFIQSTPNRLLRSDTISFPRLKRIITFLQLGISIFLIVASVVVRRQINFSLLKEPGQNHDQIVYLKCPKGVTNMDIAALRAEWKKSNPNILDVMAVSQLPDRLSSKEINSDFYLLEVDRGFRDFFQMNVLQGGWFWPNAGDSIVVTNESGKDILANDGNVIGVVEDLNGIFNQPQTPIKIKLARDFNYNWLCVRVYEVDIRRTVRQLSDRFSTQVNYFNPQFKSWIDYQDRLNKLSEMLAIISALLSCFAIYGLSVSLVRDKLKEIAVHKLFGAQVMQITLLLVKELFNQMLIALAVFGPLAYIFLTELLRTFVFATKFQWLDPVYPIAYCVLVIIAICGFQALNLNRTNIASTLKS